MKVIAFNKLVRDLIPNIIHEAGNTCETRILSEEEYIHQLDMKLGEEFFEYMESKSIEELADLLEVIFAIAKIKGFSESELERVRQKKSASRGAFEKRIMLVDVTQPTIEED